MPLSSQERERLATLARIMLPGGSGMAGAEEIGLVMGPVDRVLEIEPALTPPLVRFLARLGPVHSLAEIESLAQGDREGFKALGIVLANAYFMHPEIRRQIGYPGQEARDSSIGLTSQDLALLAPVQARVALCR